MKIIKDLNSEINQLALENNKRETSLKVFKKNSKRIDFLRYVIRFLETNPSNEFLESERIRLLELAGKINARYSTWKRDIAPKDVDLKKWKSLFNKETGLTKINKQLKTITFITS